jgi:hypothetical protein
MPWFASLFGQKKENIATVPGGLPKGAQAR